MLLRDERDLKYYNSLRYSYSSEIAQTWFKYLQNYDRTLLKELKEYLGSRTIIGEYIGHPDHQHLVLYDHVGLVF